MMKCWLLRWGHYPGGPQRSHKSPHERKPEGEGHGRGEDARLTHTRGCGDTRRRPRTPFSMENARKQDSPPDPPEGALPADTLTWPSETDFGHLASRIHEI